MYEIWLKDVILHITHWDRVMYICVGKLTIIGSDNGLSPERRQAIIWTNAGILLIGPLGANFSEILIETETFSLKKIRLKMLSAKCCSFRLGLTVLTQFSITSQLQSGAVIKQFNMAWCYILAAMTAAGKKPVYNLIKDTPYLTLTCKVWSFMKIWDHVIMASHYITLIDNLLHYPSCNIYTPLGLYQHKIWTTLEATGSEMQLFKPRDPIQYKDVVLPV